MWKFKKGYNLLVDTAQEDEMGNIVDDYCGDEIPMFSSRDVVDMLNKITATYGYVVVGRVERWDGVKYAIEIFNGGFFGDEESKKLGSIIASLAYNDSQKLTTDNGELIMYDNHHDGTNTYYIRGLRKDYDSLCLADKELFDKRKGEGGRWPEDLTFPLGEYVERACGLIENEKGECVYVEIRE